MPVEIIMPKVDMDMATGQIARWFVAEGATVRKGDTLFEIETDKAAMEIDAPASGTIRDITGKERIDIPVGQAVAWIFAEGEMAGAALTSPLRGGRVEGAGGVADRALDDPSAVAPSGETPTPALRADPPCKGEGNAGAVRATPLARRLAREAGMDLALVAGSGPNGRVVRADVEAAAMTPPSVLPDISPSRGEITHSTVGEVSPATRFEARTGKSLISPLEGEMSGRTEGGGPAEAASDPVLHLFAQGSYDLIPHDAMRKTIARRLTVAKSTIPHFYLSLDCEIDALLALRTELNASAPVKDGQPAFKLSVNDMVIKALALALRDVPEANVSWTETAMIRHKHADVGVAVSIPGGLITPIVRQADGKTLSVISSEMKDLAARAKTRKLKAEEYQGGTTSVSNLGMFGIRDFAAILNPPQATILAVGAGEARAVVKAGAVVPATVLSVTLSTDHRAVDGALGAQLLSAFRAIVEKPLRLLV